MDEHEHEWSDPYWQYEADPWGIGQIHQIKQRCRCGATRYVQDNWTRILARLPSALSDPTVPDSEEATIQHGDPIVSAQEEDNEQRELRYDVNRGITSPSEPTVPDSEEATIQHGDPTVSAQEEE